MRPRNLIVAYGLHHLSEGQDMKRLECQFMVFLTVTLRNLGGRRGKEGN